MDFNRSSIIRLVVSVPMIAVFLALALDWRPGIFSEFDAERVTSIVEQAGIMGPVLIVALMTLAVVASPLPSAPIALAAGAAYGHTFGTVYVALGSSLGAMIAFLIARHLGRDAVVRFFGDNANYGLLGSQRALTLTVFITRIIPFVSFDAVSYAAGLSGIHLWRFLVATISGIIPASFVLAHFGSEAMNGQFGSSELLIMGLGLITVLPLLWFTVRAPSETPK